MKSFISKLFSRSVTFGNDMRNCVNVLKSVPETKQCINLYTGFITSVNFNKRMVVIETGTEGIKHVPFDKVVTISRMQDGRLRMWIKVED